MWHGSGVRAPKESKPRPLSASRSTSAPKQYPTLRPIIDHIRDVERTVQSLQNEKTAVQQVDVQSKNIEFLQGQIHALRSAFTTLSEVIVGEIDSLRSEQRDRALEVDSQKVRVEGAEDAVRSLAAELAGWRVTCDKRMATITAGVNLLNTKLHDYQTENAKELANQRARIATLEQAKVDERSVLNMNSTVISRDIARLQEQLAVITQDNKSVRDKQNADLQQIYHTLQQLNQVQQANAKSLADTCVHKSHLDVMHRQIVDECTSVVQTQQQSLTQALQASLEAARASQRDIQSQTDVLRAELSSLRSSIDSHAQQTVSMVRSSEDESLEMRAIAERAFSLLAQHFSIANPWQMAMANLTPAEIASMQKR